MGTAKISLVKFGAGNNDPCCAPAGFSATARLAGMGEARLRLSGFYVSIPAATQNLVQSHQIRQPGEADTDEVLLGAVGGTLGI